MTVAIMVPAVAVLASLAAWISDYTSSCRERRLREARRRRRQAAEEFAARAGAAGAVRTPVR